MYRKLSVFGSLLVSFSLFPTTQSMGNPAQNCVDLKIEFSHSTAGKNGILNRRSFNTKVTSSVPGKVLLGGREQTTLGEAEDRSEVTKSSLRLEIETASIDEGHILVSIVEFSSNSETPKRSTGIKVKLGSSSEFEIRPTEEERKSAKEGELVAMKLKVFANSSKPISETTDASAD